jgi:hypothetical protein
MQQLARLDRAGNVNQTAKVPPTLSSGDTEVDFVYPGLGNNGPAYPDASGHFTC